MNGKKSCLNHIAIRLFIVVGSFRTQLKISMHSLLRQRIEANELSQFFL